MRLIHEKDDIYNYLNNSEFLSCFSISITHYLKLYYFDGDDYITKEGDDPEYLYYLVSGKAKLFITSPNGKNTLIDFFDSPCFIGEMELLGVYHQLRSVQALTPCYCLALPLEQCKTLLLDDVHFLRKLCTYLGTKNMRNVSSLAENKSYPLANRLAAFILIASINGYYKEMHTNASDYLGVSYRHLLYVLAEFVEKKYLSKSINGYQIVNKDALIQLAGEMNTQLNNSHLYVNMDN